MSEGDDTIPRWIGRVVTTAEVPASPGEQDVEPTAASVGERRSSPAHEASQAPVRNRRLLHVAGLAGLLVAATIAVVAQVRTPTDGTETADRIGMAASDRGPAAAETAKTPVAPVDTPTETQTRAPTPLTTIPGLSAAVLEAHRGEAWSAGQALWAIYKDGRVHIQGQVPDAEAAVPLIEPLQSAVGTGEVIAQYGIDPTSPVPTDPPLFIKDTVVFEPRSATIAASSRSALVFADQLLRRYPATTLTIVADLSAPAQPGDAADLPDQRVQAIIGFLVERGVDASRLDSELRRTDVGVVEAGVEPIEFVVHGLLGENRLSP